MELQKLIDEFDMILIGIGEDFDEKFTALNLNNREYSLIDDLKRKNYLEKNQNTKVNQAYQKLAQILNNRNYFVVTTCQDDKIFHCGLKEDRIVAPCGGYQFLQCSNVCTTDIYPFEDYKEIIEKGESLVCPHCGETLVINRIGVTKYSEEGYLPKWNFYTKWLQGTLNKKLLLIELGVGMKYPSVIRWPFEKMCFINEKSKMLRVNRDLYYMTEELKEKGSGIQEDPVEFLLNQFV